MVMPATPPQPPPDAPLLVTLDVAGEMLSVSIRTVYRLIASGDIQSMHIGASHRVVVASIYSYLARRQAAIDGQR